MSRSDGEGLTDASRAEQRRGQGSKNHVPTRRQQGAEREGSQEWSRSATAEALCAQRQRNPFAPSDFELATEPPLPLRSRALVHAMRLMFPARATHDRDQGHGDLVEVVAS